MKTEVTMQLRALDDGVWTCLQPDHGLGWSNSGFIARGGGVVVDTFWDLPRTKALLELYAGVHPAAPRRVVNTHHNGDHCWGNQLCTGAEIIGHRRCREAMLTDIAPAMMQALSHAEPPLPGLGRFATALRDYDFTGVEITPPTTVFEESMTLDLDGMRADILYVGPAHTVGDSIVHLPEQGIVFGGDVMWNGCTPIGWEGTYAQWYAALDRIIALEPRTVVPGHGPITDVEGVRTVRRYFEYVEAESKRFYEMELPEMEAAKRLDLGPYAKWTEPERLIFNVRRAYRELRGEPYDAHLDALALLREAAELGDWYASMGK